MVGVNRDRGVRIRAGERAVALEGELVLDRIVGPGVAGQIHDVNTVHLDSVGVGKRNRRRRAVDYPQRIAAAVGVDVVRAVREPEVDRAHAVGVDVVGAVAGHLDFNLGVRREASYGCLVNACVRFVHGRDRADVAGLVETSVDHPGARPGEYDAVVFLS